ncbi:MAG: fibrillarin-like rRNA/tRNA 2'-O-methyltransferase [Methanomassiliicoccaceae archaeon]|jgi:fibrillarin-like pre-rRNA processing protein|nr:fibrillarin-like rRNA/tRNA 2'-O-methyltransferase [Methanomassiliicoccaceae archaeon]
MMTHEDLLRYVDGRPVTLSSDPGKRVYGERLLNIGGKEYREWSPHRSKLSAYLCLGGKCFPFTGSGNILYLGAASGTTASHLSDIAVSGRICCVEISQRSFRDLVDVCASRKNMMPILGDAAVPDGYAFAADDIDVVYQDVAQKGQADMLADNMDRFSARYGMVSIKARSEDVTAPPERIFEKARERLIERGMKILDMRSLEPFEKAHAMIVVEALR